MKDSTIKETNQRINELKNSIFWKLMPGTEVMRVNEGVRENCYEEINGVIYVQKLITERIPIIYNGFSIIDEDDKIKEGFINGYFHKQKYVTLEQAFKYFGIEDSKDVPAYSYNKITKKDRFDYTRYDLYTRDHLDTLSCKTVWLHLIEKDKMYFNYSRTAVRPFKNAWIELK